MGLFAGVEHEAGLIFHFLAELVKSHPTETSAILHAVGDHVTKGYPATAPVVAAVETAIAP